MTRSEFAAAAFLLLAVPAGAAPHKPVPAADAVDLDAAKRLFDDPIQRQAFLYILKSDPATAARIRAALADARKAGGGDAAITAKLRENADAVKVMIGVPADLAVARKTLDAGLHASTPKTSFPENPLIGALVTGLKKKDAADLFTALDVPAYGGPKTPPAAAVKPCVPGGSTAFAQLQASAANGSVATGEPCPQTAVKANPVVSNGAATARPTLAASPPVVSDMRPTTGAPPAPGSDKDPAAKASGGGFALPFSMSTAARAGLLGAFGALIGTFLGPPGIIAGALIGAAVGAFLLKDGGAKGD